MASTTQAWEQPKARGRRVKRKQIQAGDGWTVVTHTTSGRTEAGEGHVQGMRPTRVVEGLTVERLAEDFKKLQGRWPDTGCAKWIEEILGKRRWNVERALCIGIGSFSLDWEGRWRSLWQLVLFMEIVKSGMSSKQYSEIHLCIDFWALVTKKDIENTVYAQEPAFTPLDISFLESLRITVLSTDIQTHVSNSSFVFAPFVDWYLLLPIFLKDKDPELYIGNEILDDYDQYARGEEKERKLDECNETGSRFRRGRRSVKLPEFALHPHALNGLVVYWREEEEKE